MDATSVVDTIKSGEFDDDLSEIIDAVRARFAERGSYWRIGFEDLDITEENLTIAEGTMVERATERFLSRVDPAASTTHAAAIITAALVHRRNMTIDTATKYLQRVTAKEVAQACTRYVAGDLDPKDSTGTGSE